MLLLDLNQLIEECGHGAATSVLHDIVRTESSFNPYAIGIVGDALERQPKNKLDAIERAESLDRDNKNFSIGLAQINLANLKRFGLDFSSAFDPCVNLHAAATIYNECFERASKIYPQSTATSRALSCYYSGNFTRGFLPDGLNGSSYVQRVLGVTHSVHGDQPDVDRVVDQEKPNQHIYRRGKSSSKDEFNVAFGVNQLRGD